MKAKPIIQDPTADLFRSELNSILDLSHELCLLAKQISWEYLDEEFGKLLTHHGNYGRTKNISSII